MNRTAAWLVVSLAVAAGCGGKTARTGAPEEGASEPECEWVSGCGGDPSGGWQVVRACTDLSFVTEALLACPEARIVDSMSSATGSASFDGNSYSLDITYAGELHVFIPEACVSRGPGERCEALGRAVETRGALLLDSISCHPEVKSCFCALTRAPFQWSRSGEYSLAAGMLSTGGLRRSYCVEDDRLYLSLGETSPGEALVLERETR